ncbi:hypothetical protein QYF61_011627 [Mycteria americana]|uniref:Uncharacterized protein n=1 Tax=Mycteria americana TaxID=33587 RepID=A0AAN7RZM5_MYCAM|nr:hypothetical protein QYF61_011627 [Mycteria americana]
MLLKALSNLTLNVASTTSLSNLVQCLTTLIVKNVFLMSILTLPSVSLKLLPLVLLLQALVKILKGHKKVSPEPSLLQAEQPQLSQPFSIAEGFQPSDHFRGLLWTRSNRSMSVLCWGPQSWTQCSRGVSGHGSRGAESPPSTCWSHLLIFPLKLGNAFPIAPTPYVMSLLFRDEFYSRN